MLAFTLPTFFGALGFGVALTVGWGMGAILISAISGFGAGTVLKSLLKTGFSGVRR
jgi:hypothetical protein